MEEERIELPSAIAAIRLLLFTGCRLGEILKLRWGHVDLADQALRLPDSKIGASVVHLGSAAISVLHAIDKATGNPFVIIGRNPGAHLTDLEPFWQRLRGRAGLKDARIHDLRHTFAPLAVSNWQSLPMIGTLLGHTQVQTRARYAHLANQPVIQAANDVSALITEQLHKTNLRPSITEKRMTSYTAALRPNPRRSDSRN